MKAFQALDLNDDGKISREELEEAYNNELKGSITQEELGRIMEQLDSNGSGFIDYSGKLWVMLEFLVAAANKEQVLTDDRIRACFQMFDRVICLLSQDGNGSISVKELRSMFGGLDDVQDKIWKDMLVDVDSNEDGAIQFSEFKELLNKVSKQTDQQPEKQKLKMISS